jgi:hypothetical protein
VWWVSKDVADIKTTLAEIKLGNKEIKEDLKEHIRRTSNLEGRTESIEKHVHQVQAIFKFLAWTGGVLTLVVAIGGVLVSYWTTKG